MKNLLLKSLLVITLIFSVSCSNDDEVRTTTLIFTPTASISNSETLTILTQASNAEVSELRANETTGEVYYFYRPQAGFIGHDFVRLITETGPLGSPESTVAMQANIKIEVSY